MKSLFIFFLVLIVSNLAFSQHSHVAYMTLADSLYAHHNYQEAAIYYQRALKNAKQPGNIMLKVARAYSEMNNVKEAEPWYAKARISDASFSNEDTYHYAKALIMLEKRKEAELILEDLLKADPNASFARQLLDDLVNIGKYLKDSTGYVVTPLSINTPVAEFAPEYYKDGIVFSSAQPQFITDKKYHWDDTHFLNLYYSAKINGYTFKKPSIFDKEINTKFHDGPVAFYGNDEKMILNRNQQVKVKGKVDVSMSHLSLFDVQRNTAKNTWEFTPLPFDEPPYSFAHPSVTEDGNVLYFISDKPGGYGGTDIYRVIRTDGKWSEPFNLGPSINTSENEVFPFYTDNTLYFSSDGHGGLGGLDLFKSTQYVNGFTPAENLGYPVNSHVDDFSLITIASGQNGYFASARTGNDDLFQFEKTPPSVKLIARVYDGVTKESLPGASIQLVSIAANDTTLIAGNGGNVQFELPTTSAYILIASKEGMKGMFSGMAVQGEDYRHVVHQIPLFGDTTAIPCIGNIQNEHGVAQNASTIEIIDETSGKKTTYTKDQSLVTFLGEKGHSYRVEIQNEKGDTAIHRLEIKSDDTGSKTWNMVLKETPVMMSLAARVFNAETKLPLGGANVKVITLVEPDQDLIANENGIVEFSLPMDVAYIVVGSKEGLTGMHSGLVEEGTDKNTIIHPVPAKGDPLDPVSVVALVTNSKGELLNKAKAIITDKATGEIIPGGIENGVLNFFAERGRSYNINVEDEAHRPTLEELSIPQDAKEVEKIAVVLEEIRPASYLMAARVFNETDESPMPGANVKIISFSEPDLDLIANDQGIVEFYISDGAGYIVVGTKEGYTGMHMGVAGIGTDKSSVVHPVPVNNDPASTLDIFGMVKNESGEPITHAEVEVTDIKTGERIPAKIEKGILSFNGKRGGNYQVAVTAENYASQVKTIPIDSSVSIVEPLVINLRQKMPIAAKISNKKGEILSDVSVTVTDKITGEKVAAEIVNGILSFNGEQGKQYDITVEHRDHHTVVEELIIPQMAKSVDQISIALAEKPLPLIASVADESGTPVTQAEVTVTDIATGEKVESKITNGVLSFEGKRGGEYKIEAKAQGFEPQEKNIRIDPAASAPPELEIKLKPLTFSLTSLVADEAGNPVTNAQVVVTDNVTGEKIETKIENGNLSFLGKKGGDYKIEVTADGYQPVEKQIKIDPTASTPPELDIKLQAVKAISLALTSLIADEAGKPVTNAQVVVTDNVTGEKIQTKIENGNLSFEGKKGGDYKIDVTADGYQPVEKQIKIDPTASAPPELDIKLKPVTLALNSLIADEAGKPVTNAQVVVTDNVTGEKIETKIENGNLSFLGKKGGDYKIEVTADGYHPVEKQIKLDPTASMPPELDIKLKPTSYLMSARVFRESDKVPLEGAQVKIRSFAKADMELVTDSEGIVDFTLPDGSGYVVIATSADGYVGMHSGVAVRSTSKASIIHPVPVTKEPSKQLPVFGFIADENGNVLLNAEVEVTDIATGEKVDVKMENGILAYYGKKGGAYKVGVKAEGYKEQERSVNIPPTALTVEPLGIQMERVVSYLMAARIFKESDNAPLAGAEVTIMSFRVDDIELVANSQGLVDFTLPEGSPYIIIASKDGYFGTHSGMAESGTAKANVTHQIPATNDASKPLTVLALVSDEYGRPLTPAQVVVTDNATGQTIEAKIENGILSFKANRGGDYKIEITAEEYETQVERIQIDPNATMVHPLEISVTRKKLLVLPPGSNLIIVNNETPKFYITSADNHDEIIEKDGMLYLQSKDEPKFIGKGTLSGLLRDPSRIIQLTPEQLVTLQNIYFDYNSAFLDDTDKQELGKAKVILNRYPLLQLTVRAHADLRGSTTYNMSLTRKRARAIKSYLLKQGIRSRNILPRAFGKSAPVVLCITEECTEQQHQKNRRAEFELAALRKAKFEPVPVIKPQPVITKATARTRVSPNYAKILAKYGDRQHDSLVFKVCVGAYRLNPNLTFTELTDLAQIEKNLVGGINYYYLHDFATLKNAEDIRQQVIQRGISDAYITIFYQGNKISFSKFISVTE